NDIKKENLHGLEATNALKDRKVDAFTWVTGLPTAAIMDLAATPGNKIKLINNSAHLDKITAKHGSIYAKGIIPKKTYLHVDTDTEVLTTFTILICHEKMDAGLVYNIVKELVEHQPDIVMMYKGADYFNLNTAAVGSAIPYHPGSLKYFQEKGIKAQ
ncbi:MAG: TAXI family TRAP transporter solute-binding subunit, partial [Deltaproteobacteria bacterium]|nr:TAXI family TRAP transporter solute-binding subunit [Deltaproteobacteria bacterium]